MANTTTVEAKTATEKNNHRTPVERWRDVFLDGVKSQSDDALRTNLQEVNRFFRWVKTERWDIPEEEFVHYQRPTTNDPMFSPEEICSKTKREIEELLSEHPYDAINADACIAYEKANKNRKTLLRRFQQKKRAEPKLDYIEVTEADVRKVTGEDVLQWMKHLHNDGCMKSTIQGYWYSVRDFLDWASAANNDDYDDDYFGEIRDHPISTQIIEIFISNLEGNKDSGPEVMGYERTVRLLKENRRPKDRAILMLAIKTGMRPNEITDIQFKDLHLENLMIRVDDRKKGHMTKVLIDEECRRHLEFYIASKRSTEPTDYVFTHGRNQKYSRKTLTNYFRRLGANAGIAPKTWNNGKKVSEFTPYWCRHTFSNHYVHEVNGTEKGDRTMMKIEKGHQLDVSENYSAAKHNVKLSMEQRRQDYEQAVPNYLG